jgi:hypothetical protein
MQWRQDNHIYRAQSAASTQADLKQALETCAAKAIALLDHSIQEDSLYLLFEWDSEATELAIVVTDASKRVDSMIRLHINFPLLANNPDMGTKAELAESIHFWLKDYLASCSAFFAYSLVAIFHSSTRDNSQLL